MQNDDTTRVRRLALGTILADLALIVAGAIVLPEPARVLLPIAGLVLPLFSATLVEAVRESRCLATA